MKIGNIFILLSLTTSIAGCDSYQPELSKAEKQASSGNTKARFQLAMHYAGREPIAEKYLRGHDQIDYRKSAHYLMSLSDGGDANAMFILASLYSSHYYIDDDNYLSTRSRCDAIDIIESQKKCFWIPSEKLKKIARKKHNILIEKASQLGHTKSLIQKSKNSNDCTTAVSALKKAAYDNGSLLAALRLGIIYQSLHSGEYYQPKTAYKLLNLVASNTNQKSLRSIQLNHLAKHYKNMARERIENTSLNKMRKKLTSTGHRNSNCQFEFSKTPALNNLLGS